MRFALQTSGDLDTLVDAADWAERRGLDCLAIPDHYVLSRSGDGPPAYDAFVLLGGLAASTASIELSLLVSPITFRHPAVIAKSALTVDAISGGRFTLGIGTGWLEIEHEVFGIPLPPMAERFERMEEALGYVRAHTRGESFEGRHYRLRAVEPRPAPTDGFRLVVGGKGSRRTPTLAGRFADEYNVYPAAPDELRSRIELARQAAEEAGRDPDALLISSSGSVLVGRDEADYRRRFAETAASAGLDEEELEEHFAFRSTPRGPAPAVREQLAQMEALGVRRFYLQTSVADGFEGVTDTLEMLSG